jgi:Guanosine polyphosphate pyrophosphohydrolases/synthetases
MLDKFKNIISDDGSKYPKDFQIIINNLYYNAEPDNKIIKFVWNAYNYSKNAHTGQLRKSGEPYFSHCSAVGIIFIRMENGFLKQFQQG